MRTRRTQYLARLCDDALTGALPESLRAAIRDGIAAGCTVAEVVRRAQMQGAAGLLLAAVEAEAERARSATN